MNDVTNRRQRGDVEARVGRRLAALLNDAGGPLEPTVAERLRFAREQALARAVTARRVATAVTSARPVALPAVAGGAPLPDRSERWFRLGAVVPLLLLIIGLLVIQEWHLRSQISAAAEIDVALLGDDLPPAAYADPGFLEFLKQPND